MSVVDISIIARMRGSGQIGMRKMTTIGKQEETATLIAIEAETMPVIRVQR